MDQMTWYLIAIGLETVALIILMVRQVNHRAAIEELMNRTMMIAEAFNHLHNEVKEVKEQEREKSNA
jgi:hypothetical protein